jgi:hypothetical protein
VEQINKARGLNKHLSRCIGREVEA